MYLTTCSIAGCTKKTKRHTRLCSRHQNNQRRHGDPRQRPLGAYELRPWTRRVRELINGRKNKEAIWSSLLEAYELIIRQATAEVLQVKASKGPFHGPSLEAAQAILTVSREAQAEDIVTTLVSLGFLQACEPRRFISDDAFRATLALRFRRLASSSFRSSINPTTGSRHWVSQEFSPRVQQVIAQRLTPCFVAFGSHLYEVAVRETEKATEVKTAPITLLVDEEEA